MLATFASCAKVKSASGQDCSASSIHGRGEAGAGGSGVATTWITESVHKLKDFVARSRADAMASLLELRRRRTRRILAGHLCRNADSS